MNDAVQQALAITPSSSARDRTVDITTIGRQSGQPRRIEIWFHRVFGKYYLTGTPAKRDWYANLVANPHFTFHLKHDVRADLPATATPITDEAERRRVFTAIVDDFNQPQNPAGVSQPVRLEAWLAGSPLVEIAFDMEAKRT